MATLDWLTARPVAHRGLHNTTTGIIENTPSAFSAAIAGNYAIECDLQVTADGEAMVHHDDKLGRLTEGSDRLDAMTAAELKRVRFLATSDPMITLGELCDLVAGRVTLLIELKSRLDGDRHVVARAAQVLSNYRGPAALMSFDPAQVAMVREVAPRIARGIVAESHYPNAKENSSSTTRALSYIKNALRSRPQFIAYSVKDLPAVMPFCTRTVFRMPLLTWTVRTDEDRARAARYADQMIFERFRP